jgi:hypothetical protein
MTLLAYAVVRLVQTFLTISLPLSEKVELVRGGETDNDSSPFD